MTKSNRFPISKKSLLYRDQKSRASVRIVFRTDAFSRPLASFFLYSPSSPIISLFLFRFLTLRLSSHFLSPLLSSFLHRLSLLSHFYSSLSRSRYLNCPSAEIFSRIANLWTSPSMDRANDVLVYLYRYVRPRTGTNSTRERDKDKGTRIDEKNLKRE